MKKSSSSVLLLLCASAMPMASFTPVALAQGTHLWTESTYAEWEKGTPTGVAIGSDGTLTPGPALATVATMSSADVWAVASDSGGNAYVATGSPAQVVRIAPDGRQTVLFTSKEVSVQTLDFGSDGALYAATLPSAKIFRIDVAKAAARALDEGTAPVVFDGADTAEKPHYIWAIRFDNQKRMYIATGAPGAIYRMSMGAKPELFFKSDEPHIKTMEFAPNGDLLAGSAGTGLLYRIAPSGEAFVQFEAQKGEITAIALGKQGQTYLAAVGEKGRASGVPGLPVGTPGTASVTVTVVQPGSAQAVSNNTGVADGSEVYLLPAANGQAPRTLWTAHDDIVYGLHWTPDGLLASTGNRGRLFRLQDDGTLADVGHADAGQVIGFAPAGAHSLFAAAANTGKLLRLDLQPDSKSDPSSKSTLLSDVFDATQPSEWGRVEVMAAGTPGAYRLETRTGNLDNPARGWSEWKPVTSADATLGQPAARFAQWRLTLHAGARVEQVGVNYLPANAAPVVDEVMVAPGTRVNASAVQVSYPQQTTLNFASQGGAGVNLDANSPAVALSAIRDKGEVTARWAAHDDNGDDLRFALYTCSASGAGAESGMWRLLKENLSDRYYSFDASLLPDGPYRLKVVATDAASHPAGEALTGERVSDLFVVDTETPSIEAMTAAHDGSSLHIKATANDQKTPIARAEYSIDSGPWQYVDPVGRLSDALTEQYDFTAALPTGAVGPHTVTLRVFDRYENEGSAKAVAQ